MTVQASRRSKKTGDARQHGKWRTQTSRRTDDGFGATLSVLDSSNILLSFPSHSCKNAGVTCCGLVFILTLVPLLGTYGRGEDSCVNCRAPRCYRFLAGDDPVQFRAPQHSGVDPTTFVPTVHSIIFRLSLELLRICSNTIDRMMLLTNNSFFNRLFHRSELRLDVAVWTEKAYHARNRAFPTR